MSQDLLRGLEKADRNVRLSNALEVLAALGFDIVLVSRDPSLGLQEPRPSEASSSSSSARHR